MAKWWIGKKMYLVDDEVREQLEQLQAENEQMKNDLAIIHEHTNLTDSNKKEIFVEEMRMIRKRSRKYESLRRTAGPIF